MRRLRLWLPKLFRIQQHVYIHLTESWMYIAHVKKNKHSYRQLASTLHELKHTQVSNNRLYNLTALHKHVANFITANNLRNPRLSINTTLANQKTPCTVLQLALCFSKSSLQIETLTAAPNGSVFPQHLATIPIDHNAPNLLEDFLPSHHKNAHWALAATVTCLLFACIGLTAFQRTVQADLTNATTQLQSRKHELQAAQNKATTLQNLEKTNKALQEKITVMNSQLLHNNNPCTICATIAKKMPKQSYLTFLEIGSQDITDKKEPAPQTIPLTLRGTTSNPREVNDFVKHLNDAFTEAQFSLDRIRKAQKTKNATTKARAPHVYSFTINGVIQS